MKKKGLFLGILFIFFLTSTFAQKYFRIEGTKKILNIYSQKSTSKLNDSTTVSYIVRKNNFYIAVKVFNKFVSRYVKYDIMSQKDKARVKSLGRGSNDITRVRYIYVTLLKPEKINMDSRFIERVINN